MKIILQLRIYAIAFVAFVMMLASYSESSAQGYASHCQFYKAATFSAGYTSIIGQSGTNYLGVGPYGYYSFPYYYTATSLPFAFNYDSTDFAAGTTMYLDNNGAMSFAYTGNWDYGQSISTNQQTTFPLYMNAWGMCYYPYNYTGGIYTQVSGFAPNRTWTVEYSNVSCYYSGYSVNVQIKLYETTNAIEYWYSSNSYNMQYGYVGDIGINGATNGDFQGAVTNAGTFTYASPFYTPATQLRYSPNLNTNTQLSFSPKLLNFGTAQVGSSTDLLVTVKNAGTSGTLVINTTTITGNPDFSIVGGTPVPPMLPGQSNTFTVRCTPQSPGARSANLNITSNGKDSGSVSIPMFITGTAPDISVDSTTRFKKTRTRMGDSLTQWIHITSIGKVGLAMSSYPITGQDAGQYFISHFPSAIIQPGVTDSLGITYVPTLEGKHVATMTINSNAFASPVITVSLQGTGILPHIVLTPTLLLFDSTKEGVQSCKTIDIWNPGSDTLKISKNYLSSNDGDFQFTGLSGADLNIAPDQHKTVTICFTPLQQGSRQARLVLKTNIINTFDTPRRDTAAAPTIDIRGTGVPFGVFANSLIGTNVNDSSFIGVQVCRTATLKNDGDADILVKGITLSGPDVADFNYSGLPAFPFLLKARTSMTFTVCGTPDKQGVLSATVTVTGTTGGTTISSDLALGLFGIKACVGATPPQLFETTVLPMNGSDSTLCVTVNNCGDLDAIYKVTISGKNASDYTVTPAISGNVVSNTGTTQFCVKFKPSAIGTSTASLDVVASDNSASVSVPLLGQGGCAVVNATADAVPATGVLAKNTFDVTINNTGTFEWTANAATVTPNDGVFSVLNLDKPTAAAPIGSIVVHMQFAPTKLGNASAILTFPNAAPCENAPISVTLNGEGIVNGVNDAAAEGFTLEQSYPNPTQGNATFTYTTPCETEVRISVVDLTGKLIRTLITGRVSEGAHTVNFDATGIASGTYIYMLESGSTRLVRQLVVTK